MFGYALDVEDYYVNLHLNTQMELPDSRDSVLHFFETMRKAHPDLSHFHARENGDLTLEGDKSQSTYGWISIEAHRLCSARVNPESLEIAYKQHELVLDLAPAALTLSELDCEAIDVMYGFDFIFEGNHDEVVAEALGFGPGLESLLDIPNAQLTKFEPMITLAIDEERRLQCRLALETRSNPVPGRPGFTDDLLSVYFTVRQFWSPDLGITFSESFRRQCELGEELLESRVIPKVIKPLAQVIARRENGPAA